MWYTYIGIDERIDSNFVTKESDEVNLICCEDRYATMSTNLLGFFFTSHNIIYVNGYKVRFILFNDFLVKNAGHISATIEFSQ